ncbi:hypothetical protein R1sor_013950 [Riccia sorocarpa]|uniref:30S ribosomal protein S16, chloroplastic n=1 Tax=Riccia sorocarpa TaxID=122646 RepID=A0ABD3HC60_9MARC
MAVVAGTPCCALAAASLCSVGTVRATSTGRLVSMPSIASPALRLSRVIYTAEKKTERRQGFKGIVAAAVAEAEAPAVAPSQEIPRPKKIGKGVVRLRLARFGRKKRPFYRIVATHSSWRRDGKNIELLGHYNPLHAPNELGIVVKADRIKYWLGVGAQPSDTVAGILHKVGILKATEVEPSK